MYSLLNWRAVSALASVGFLMTVWVQSATAADLNLTVRQTYLLDEILVKVTGNQAKGFSQLLRIPGKRLLVVVLESDVNWDENTKKLKIPSEEILLSDAGGESFPPIGEMKYYAGLNTHVGNVYHSRPRKWKDGKGKPKKHYLVFAVDGQGKAYTLKMGPSEAKLAVPDEVTTLGPNMIAEYNVTSARAVKKVPGKLKINKVEYQTTHVSLSDTFLAVDIEIAPKPPLEIEDRHFFWHTGWFALKDELGGFAPVSGEVYFDALTNNVSHNKSRNKPGEKWETLKGTLYFPVSSRAKRFQLLCAGQAVADFTLP